MNKSQLLAIMSITTFFLAGCNLGIQQEATPPPVREALPPVIEVEEPESEAREIPELTALFMAKYPKYKDTLKVRVDQQTETHARGGISFVEGQAGGYFLAAKVSGEWMIVLDGNGQIPCTLSEQGFPPEMISDCAS